MGRAGTRRIALAVADDVVEVAEGFAVVAGDDDERVVGQAALAKEREESGEVVVGLADRVEVALHHCALLRLGFVEVVDQGNSR